jgi:hypothetical protein
VIPEFHYYTLELDGDEPLISLLPFNNKARLASIWGNDQLYNVFDLDYIVEELKTLWRRLSKDIEEHYNISLKPFISKGKISFGKALHYFIKNFEL